MLKTLGVKELTLAGKQTVGQRPEAGGGGDRAGTESPKGLHLQETHISKSLKITALFVVKVGQAGETQVERG